MDRTEVARGKQIVAKYCARCHGSQGKGDGYQLLGPSPANRISPMTEERSDDDLLRTIHEGKPNMPAWKHRLSRQDSRDVLTNIRSLSAVQGSRVGDAVGPRPCDKTERGQASAQHTNQR
jgi:mono/diheme cytochrome c family protein